jgi:cytochrome c peroxidase
VAGRKKEYATLDESIPAKFFFWDGRAKSLEEQALGQ